MSVLPPQWKVVDDNNPDVKSLIEVMEGQDLIYFIAKSVRIDFINMNVRKHFMGTIVAPTKSEPNPVPFHNELDLKILLKSFSQQTSCGGLDANKFGDMLTSSTRGKKIGNTWFSNR